MHLSRSENYRGGVRIGYIIGCLTQYRPEHATWHDSLFTESDPNCGVEFGGPRLLKRIPFTTCLKHPQKVIPRVRDRPSQ